MMQNLWIWLLVAFLVGVLLEWLLEMFFFRRRWRVMVETCEKNLAQARVDLKAKSAEVDAALKAKADLSATLQARDKEIADLNAQLAKAKADWNAALGEKANLTTTLQLRDKEAGDFKLQIGKLTADLIALTAAKAALDAALKSRDAEIGDLRTQLAKLQADLDASKKFSANADVNLQARDKEIADLKLRLGKAEADLKAALSDKSGFSANLQARDKESADLKAQLAKLAAELTAIGAAKATLDATVKSRDTELADYKARASKFQIDLDGLNRRIVVLEGDLTACRKGREELTAERDRLAKEIADLRAKLSAPPAPAVLPRRSADDETPYQSACPQHLSDVKGIGSVYEQRLYENGVGTFWELAKLSNDDIKRFLKITDLQLGSMNFDEIRADSMRLAAESRSKGRKWSGGAPDDFEPMEGIGHVFEKRLYDAGVCTYASLAELTPEILDEICESPRIKPDYKNWIKQAHKARGEKSREELGGSDVCKQSATILGRLVRSLASPVVVALAVAPVPVGLLGLPDTATRRHACPRRPCRGSARGQGNRSAWDGTSKQLRASL